MRTNRKSAFSLVEVTLALGVAALSLTAVFGLLPVGLGCNRDSSEQTVVNGILSAIASDLRSTATGGATNSAGFGIPLPASPVLSAPAATEFFCTGEGKYQATRNSDSRYKVTVTFQTNSSARSATLANIKASWPAQAAAPSGTAGTFIALDRN